MEERGRSLLMAVLLLLVAFVPAHCDDSAKPVSTVLRASWPDTPLLLEARYTSINRQNTHSGRFDLAHLDSISPPYSCSEFVAEYKESLFWNFVNRTKSLRPLELTDKGMFSYNCLAIGDHMTPRCDHMTILHPHRYVQCRAGDCRVVTTIISLQSPRFLSLSPPVLASYRDVSTGMFVHLIAGDHTLLPGVTMLRLPWSN